MRLFGEYAGMAFQIKDDLFDYQKSNVIGKPTGNDLREKKITLPLIPALNQVGSSEKSRILKIVRKRTKTSADLREVRDFVEAQGGFTYAETVMHEYVEKAIGQLANYPESEVKTALIVYVNYISSRVS